MRSPPQLLMPSSAMSVPVAWDEYQPLTAASDWNVTLTRCASRMWPTSPPRHLPLDVKVRGFYEVVPDLVVEIVSPNDSPQYVADRVAMWLSHGVRLVWAVYPVSRTVAAHPSAGPTLIYTENDELDGGDVLPEFRCSVRDILDW